MPAAPSHLDQDRPCTADGWTSGGYAQRIWTPLGFLRRGDRYILVCPCGHRRDAPLQQLVDAGRGDRPMHTLKWKRHCQDLALTFDLELTPDPYAIDHGVPRRGAAR